MVMGGVRSESPLAACSAWPLACPLASSWPSPEDLCQARQCQRHSVRTTFRQPPWKAARPHVTMPAVCNACSVSLLRGVSGVAGPAKAETTPALLTSSS